MATEAEIDHAFNEALAELACNIADQREALNDILVIRDMLQGRQNMGGAVYQDMRDSWAHFVRKWRQAGGRLTVVERCDCGECMERQGRLTARLIPEPA